MRIAINAAMLGHRKTGTARYTVELIRALLEMDRMDTYHIVTDGTFDPAELPEHPHLHLDREPFRSRFHRIIWEQTRLNRRIKGADVVHGPYLTLPVRLSAPSVVTVHDMVPFLFASTIPQPRRAYLQWLFARNTLDATELIAVSESTKRGLLEYWPQIDPARVHVIAEGVDPEFRPVTDPAEQARVRERYGLPAEGRLILYVSTIEPRKNHQTLVAAFEKLIAEPDLAGVRLVLAGGRGWLTEPILDTIRRSPAADRIVLTGFVEQSDLPILYSTATVSAYPSLYEGFGLPLLEAMACGTPVVAADASSLPEVLGDAGLLVPTLDADRWADALGRMLRDTALHRQFQAAGLDRAAGFTWQAAALATLDVYRRAARTPRHSVRSA